MKPWSQETYIKAWDFASRVHNGQTYATSQAGESIAYINHIGAVAMEVMWAITQTPTCDGDLAVQCALLHDVIEDTSYTQSDLAALFGQAVAQGVAALSKNPELPKAEQMADSLQRIRQQPQEIWMVKMADRINNLDDPPFYWENAKKLAYREEARLIYQQLHRANDHLAERLQSKIAAYDQYLEPAIQV